MGGSLKGAVRVFGSRGFGSADLSSIWDLFAERCLLIPKLPLVPKKSRGLKNKNRVLEPFLL